MIESVIYAVLTGAATLTESQQDAVTQITALVGARIRPASLNQGDVRPYLEYEVEGTEATETLDGPGDFTYETIRIDCYGDTYEDARNLNKLIRTALDGFGGIVGSIEVTVALYQGTQDLSLPAEYGLEKPIYCLASNYRVMFQDAGGTE